MHIDRNSNAGARESRLSISLARTSDDVRAAQRLRWQVFAYEQGADLGDDTARLDADALDPYCDHLVVKQTSSGQVVGTYRLLTSERARCHGQYYSENEFDLSALRASGRKFLEIGRSCVHPDHRNGATISLLWSGIASYLMNSKHDAIIGCASVSLAGNFEHAARLAHQLANAHTPTSPMRVTPLHPLPLQSEISQNVEATVVPPLIKGYLRSGAVICGAPCWDKDFKTADLFMYLPVEKIELRYARHFMGHSA